MEASDLVSEYVGYDEGARDAQRYSLIEYLLGIAFPAIKATSTESSYVLIRGFLIILRRK